MGQADFGKHGKMPEMRSHMVLPEAASVTLFSVPKSRYQVIPAPSFPFLLTILLTATSHKDVIEIRRLTGLSADFVV